MPLDVNALAAEVALAIKSATAPLLERLATLEAKQAVLGDVRDKVVTLEAKAAQPLVAASVDWSPVLERIAATEARVEVLRDLRDRVVAMETKAAPFIGPVPEPAQPVDLSPLLERLAASEARLAVLGDLRDRLVVMETKAAQPAPVTPVVDLAPLMERLSILDARIETKTVDYAPVLASVADLTKEQASLRDRVAAVEVVPMQPVERGPAGRDGVDGKDGASVTAADVAPLVVSEVAKAMSTIVLPKDGTGITDAVVDHDGALLLTFSTGTTKSVGKVTGKAGQNGMPGLPGRPGDDGKDGADGLGIDDLIVTHDDDRTVTIKAARGERVKEIGTVRFPVEIYRGVFVDGKSYERGDCATRGGSEWHCNEPTAAKPGDGSKAWTLKVKKGRDGKDGRDAATAPPVVKLR